MLFLFRKYHKRRDSFVPQIGNNDLDYRIIDISGYF